MNNVLKLGSLAVMLMASTTIAHADEGKVVTDQSVDRTMTFAIPVHAIQSVVSTLTEKSDFTVFVDKECPVELQQLALRKLWKYLPTEKTDSPFS
jgi:Protein of unknown function (DUF3306)